MVTTFLTSALTIVIRNKVCLLVLGIASLILIFNYFKPSWYFYPDDAYYLNKMLPEHQTDNGEYITSTEYRHYSEDYLLLPKTVIYRPSVKPKGIFTSITSIQDIINLKEISSVDIVADIRGKGLLGINKYYFPGWYIKVNGKFVKPDILEPNGTMGLKFEDDYYPLGFIGKKLR